MSSHHCLRCANEFPIATWRCPRCGYEPEQLEGYRLFAPQAAAATDGFESRFFDRLAETEPGSFWFRSRNALIVWAIRRYFPVARSVLEIGCGTGYVLAALREALPEASLTGTEILSHAFAHARERAADAELIQADARHLPYTDTFDVIGAFDVIEHIEEDDAVLHEMHRAATKGGGVILTVPQHEVLWSAADAIAHHKRRYRRRDLVRKMRGAGFDVLRATSFVSLLLPALIASRVRLRSYEDAVAELKLPRWLDAALQGVMTVERSAIRAGINWPIGGSLLVVARKRGG